MFEAIGHCPKGQDLDSRKRGSLCLPIGHHTRQRRHLADPAAIFFLFQLDPELSDLRHGHSLKCLDWHQAKPTKTKNQVAICFFVGTLRARRTPIPISPQARSFHSHGNGTRVDSTGPSNEVMDAPSKLARFLFREGVLLALPLRASNEGLLRPRVARAQESNRPPSRSFTTPRTSVRRRSW